MLNKNKPTVIEYIFLSNWGKYLWNVPNILWVVLSQQLKGE